MEPFILYIVTAIALVFVIEGLLYALFPDAVRKMMAMAITMPVPQLRTFGAIMIIAGLGVIWLLQSLMG